VGLFSRKAKEPPAPGTSEELAQTLVDSLGRGDVVTMRTALASDRFDALARYGALSGYVVVGTRTLAVRDKLRSTVTAAEGRALPDQVDLLPAARSVVTAMDTQSLDALELNSGEEVAYALFMTAAAIMSVPEGRAQLDALTPEGYWASLVAPH
jgi:molybdopterin-binding protein